MIPVSGTRDERIGQIGRLQRGRVARAAMAIARAAMAIARAGAR